MADEFLLFQKKKKAATYRKSTWLHAEVRVNVIASTELSNKKFNEKPCTVSHRCCDVAFRVATMTAQCLEEILLKYALRPTIIYSDYFVFVSCGLSVVHFVIIITSRVYSNCAFVFGTIIATLRSPFEQKLSESNQNI